MGHSGGGKGDDRRRAEVPDAVVASNWERTFGASAAQPVQELRRIEGAFEARVNRRVERMRRGNLA